MIAVLSSNWGVTAEWLRLSKGNGRFNSKLGIFTADNGLEYLIVTNRETASGWRFTSYEKCPGYETLEDIVKTRIQYLKGGK